MTKQRREKFQRICGAIERFTAERGRAPGVHELADYCAINRGTMSQHLAIMEAQGWVRRRQYQNRVFIEVVAQLGAAD